MNNENEIDFNYVREQQRKHDIESMLEAKQLEYKKAIEQDNFDQADKVVDEYNNLVTELRFIDPGTKLSTLERNMQEDADSMTYLHNKKLNRTKK